MKICVLGMMAVLLAGCGGGSGSTVASNKPAAGKAAPVVRDDAVAAVLESQGSPVGRLSFVIDSRPVMGRPFRVQLIAASSVPLSRLSLSLESDDFAVDAAVTPVALRESGSGTSREYIASQDVTVSARHDGLGELTVHVTGDADAPEGLYVIPVLVAKPVSPG